MEEKDNKRQLQIEIPEEQSDGTYSNFTIVSHSGAEFIFDFARITPGRPKAKVKSRVIMTPIHAKNFVKILQENIQKYEATFGAIPDNSVALGFPPNSTKKGHLPN
ncbi:MAG: DUF3467 domain-containing protein [Candidatus Marinimicrobia bacterium]|nr:DUF3467 domain-containing protein [Candidatus Neomarinimicrobiota bacterium]